MTLKKLLCKELTRIHPNILADTALYLLVLGFKKILFNFMTSVSYKEIIINCNYFQEKFHLYTLR